jgi:asparagine synthetase B (glutamine-hydrolysing)
MDKSLLLQTIDPLSHLVLLSRDVEEGFLAASSLAATPLQGERLLEEGDHIVLLSGDLVGTPTIPWQQILNVVKNGDHKSLREYRGNFALAHYHKTEKTITLVSDRRGQHPVYYQTGPRSFAFSTELSTFCRLNKPAVFNENWLHEYFFFNYPVGQTTALKDVHRLLPAAVLRFSLRDSTASCSTYAEMFQPKPKLLVRPRSYELATALFKERIPAYFQGADSIACALTSGWDGRTLLAFAPDRQKVLTYTYGVKGCQDLREAESTAHKVGVGHRKILFDEGFVRRLPELMTDTVFLSGGSEKILRSTLLHVYLSLTDAGTKLPLTISGIGMDGIWRGHSQPPAIVSTDMANVFRSGVPEIREPFWSNVFPDHFSDFKETIQEKLSHLRRTFGDFRSPGHHLLFKLYVTHPELFGGELKIAEHFTTVRVPAWDPDLIDLAFSVQESGLTFSELAGHQRGDISEVKLQAHVLRQVSPLMARIPVGSTRPDIVLQGRLCRSAYGIYRRMTNRMKALTLSYSPLEDWGNWLNVVHRDFIDSLIFSERSLLRDYVGKGFFENVRQSRDIHWIGKLATAEIVLRLAKNRWQK